MPSVHPSLALRRRVADTLARAGDADRADRWAAGERADCGPAAGLRRWFRRCPSPRTIAMEWRQQHDGEGATRCCRSSSRPRRRRSSASTSTSTDAKNRTYTLVLLVDRAGWSSAGQPGLPEMLAVENAALHEYFESGLRSWRPSSSRAAALDGARRAQRRAHHVRRDATEVGAWHWPSAAKVLPICTHTCTILPSPERLPGCSIWVCT